MRLTRTHIPILLGLALIVGAAIAAIMLINSPTSAQAAEKILKENSAKVHSELANDLSPERPLVIVMDIFQKGGYRTVHEDNPNHVAVYDERVTQKTVITPNTDGLAVSVDGELSNRDGTPPAVKDLLTGESVPAPVGNTGADDSSGTAPGRDDLTEGTEGEPGPTGRTGAIAMEPWSIKEWLDGQLGLPAALEQQGYKYVGRFELNGQPSIRYEHRVTLATLPNGQVFDPPVESVGVVEFIESNPLLGRESHYIVDADGTTLEFEKTIKSVSAGESRPATSSGP